VNAAETPWGSPPADSRADLERLAAALDRDVPAKLLDRNVLLCTWNIRSLTRFASEWVAPQRGPKRDMTAIHSLAEIISRFDVVAIEEVGADTAALRAIDDALGDHWSVILSNETQGRLGNDERIAFFFDTRRVQLSGLACQVVVTPEHLERAGTDYLARQFARTPYAVGFRAGAHTMTLVAAHIIWGSSRDERLRELRTLARWLEAWSHDPNAWDHNLITLGDFNIDRVGGDYDLAFGSTGLFVPDAVRTAQRSIFATPRRNQIYDQIAWFEEGATRPLSFRYQAGGSFDFTQDALASRRLSLIDMSWRLSDHLPLWVEFAFP
jgi:endonuclease/exonuclease/phosphatase family metal-dependent hydrolase